MRKLKDMTVSKNAIQYAFAQLCRIAGYDFSNYGVQIIFKEDQRELVLDIKGGKQVIFKLIRFTEIKDLLNGCFPVKNIKSFDNKIEIPVFPTNGRSEIQTETYGTLIIYPDILTITFILLSRFEEAVTEKRDSLNRFEYKNSLAAKYGFIDIPLVDEYAMLLRVWFSSFMPGIKFQKHEGTIIPSHDVDEIKRFGTVLRNIKTIIGGDLLARRSIPIALKSIKQLHRTYRQPGNDPLVLALEQLLTTSKIHSLISRFYFIGLRNWDVGATYDIFNPMIKQLMERVKSEGMHIGMHGSYNSYNDESVFKKEKENIESSIGEEIVHGRQHFLRFEINKTLQIWDNCGIEYDSTLGYVEREGFRCGTCHEYQLYDFGNDLPLKVKEQPLIVMEGTLVDYQGYSHEKALEKLLMLYNRCKTVEGNFVILWHNGKVFREYEKCFNDIYLKFFYSVFN